MPDRVKFVDSSPQLSKLCTSDYVSTDNQHSPIQSHDSAHNYLINLNNTSGGLDYVPLDRVLQKRIASGDPFFSLEFFPPRTINGTTNLLNRLDRMSEGSPLFVDFTWHQSSKNQDPCAVESPTTSLGIASACLNYCGLRTVLHVTCAGQQRAECIRRLRAARHCGVRNILALRGDVDDTCLPTLNNSDHHDRLNYASEFVQLITKEFDRYFVIIVAGYPTGHPEAESYDADLRHLKEKVDHGASVIITQLFFCADDYFKFVTDCRTIGITIPIIPGVLPIQSYDSLRHMQKLSKLKVPQFIFDEVDAVKQNDEAVRKYGVNFAVKMCRQLLADKRAPGIHFYTLNREIATREILQQLGLWKESCVRPLPWKPITSHHKRCRETVRPIFWASRPKSYLHRTRDWNDFPNGRWGNSSNPAFGDLKDYYLFYSKEPPGTNKKLIDLWGGPNLNEEQDVWRVFVDFISGRVNERGVKVDRLPWGEEGVAAETMRMKNDLIWCNANGILTINSQPNVNGAPSTDPVVGWGNPNGYVYQKAYLEFFINMEHLDALKLVLRRYSTVNFHVINCDASIDLTNSEYNNPVAVTWGVFSGCEIAQPTVVDPISFHVWKDEAFGTWLDEWGSLYEISSTAKSLLQKIHDSYCLVTLVDNDYLKDCILWSILREMLDLSEKFRIQPPDAVTRNIIDDFDRNYACSVIRNGTKLCN